VYDSATKSNRLGIFPPQSGKEYHKTAGFRRRYVHKGTQTKSYRKVSAAYNEETFQAIKCSSRSLQEMVVAEGKKVNKLLDSKSLEILKQYGVVHTHHKTQVSEQTQAAVCDWSHEEESKVEAAYKEVKSKCRDEVASKLEIDLKAYECADTTINISNDDVCVKEQKKKRKGFSKAELEQEQEQRKKEKKRVNGRKVQKKRKYLYQNATHFERKGKSYKIIGERLVTQLNPITAFLLSNEGLAYNWVFFVDGQRTINDCIKHRFSWRNIDIVLDWYHLDKKINKQMYRALKSCTQRDEVMQEIKKWAWHGLVDEAIKCISQIDEELIRNQEELEILAGYFERNRTYIKCYSVRKELGLRLSSNRVEKTNDELVSHRQKKKGISFTRNGSYGLAVIKSLELNNERENWIKNQNIKFKFAA